MGYTIGECCVCAHELVSPGSCSICERNLCESASCCEYIKVDCTGEGCLVELPYHKDNKYTSKETECRCVQVVKNYRVETNRDGLVCHLCLCPDHPSHVTQEMMFDRLFSKQTEFKTREELKKACLEEFIITNKRAKLEE